MAVTLHDRYAMAEALLPDRWKDSVVGGRVAPQWIGDGPDFWYRQTNAAGSRFVLVDGQQGVSRPAFDHDAVAAALSELLHIPVDPFALPLTQLRLSEETAVFNFGGTEMVYDLASSGASLTGASAPRFDESLSPDGRCLAFVHDHDLWLRDRASGEERRLTWDGEPDYSYGTPPDVTSLRHLLGPLGTGLPPLLLWSSDSRRIVTHRIDQRGLELMHLVQSKPPGGGRPLLHSYRYAMVGDERVATAEMVIIDVGTGASVFADCPPVLAAYASPFSLGFVSWAPGERQVLFLASSRGAKSLVLWATDVQDGATRRVHDEQGDLPVLAHPVYGHRPNVRLLPDGRLIWWSDHSGWGHLYLIDQDGSTRPLTSGEWLVVDLVGADLEHAYFTAVGREEGIDPYARSFYRVALDTAHVETLLSDQRDHLVTASPDANRFVDVVSWVDQPATSLLLNQSGEVIAKLDTADASALFAAGYQPPERFVVKAADGTTDIFGLLYRPSNLDPAGKYPVLDDMYPGPQINAGCIRFPRAGGKMTHDHAASMAALGFVVVVIDGRGTPLRSKAFHMATRDGGDSVNLDDHVAAIEQLASRYPWLDLDRVGIYGHSGGGYTSTKALLLHPAFFKAAVSSAGGHDDLMYHSLWGETFVGPPDDAIYGPHANETHAANLVGKLLLIHGEMDDNVTPYLTLRLVDALVAADKDFDLLIIPNEEHSLIGRQSYWWRRRWDYFVTHLLGETPPRYSIKSRPIDLQFLVEAMSG